MSTAQAQLIEFRCDTCYQTRHEPVEMAGLEAECRYCHSSTLVPEATEDRLRSADLVEKFATQSDLPDGMFSDSSISEAEIDELARERATEHMAKPTLGGVISVEAMSCERWKRIAAYLVDYLLGIIVLVSNIALAQWMSGFGICPDLHAMFGPENKVDADFNGYLCYFGIAFVAQVVVWWMIAVHGQSPGKMLLGIKIVDSCGNTPGFIKGIVLRYWVSGLLLSVVPFAGIANLISFFYGEPPRCIHDYIAATWVIDKS